MKQAYFKYILGLLILGSNGVIASFISMSSYEIVLTRSFFGGCFLWLLILFSRQPLRIRTYKKELLFMMISGAAMGVNWMCLYEGYTQIGVSLSTLLCYCGPVLVLILSPVFFKEKLTLPKILGFCAVMTGMILINQGSLSEGKSLWGLFCGMMAAVSYAVMLISNKKARHITGLENAALQILFAFVTIGIFILFKQGLTIHIQSADWLPVLILGLFNTGVGIYLYFSPISKLPVQSVAICGYMEPLSAVIFSVIFLGEVMLPVYILGGACIIGGAMFGELYKTKRQKT